MANAQTLAPRPTHIPETLLYDFDIHRDAGLLSDPHKRVLEIIREAPPVFWTPRNGGHWMVLKYQDVFNVLRDTAVFSSSLIPPEHKAAIAAMTPPGEQRIISMTPIFMDPPDHTRYRLPLQRAFSPKTMTALKGDVEALAHELVDAVIDKGGCDFFSDIAEQLPVRVFLRLMGLPEDRLAEYRALVREIFAPAGDDPMAQIRRMRRIVDVMTPAILARREAPTSDLISQLWAMEVEAQPMTLELMEDYAGLIFLAGLDTVINAMSFGVRHLALHPRLQAQLRARPELIDEAAEELLRRYTFTMTMRRVTTDTELAGATLKAGETVIVYMPAADLDADQFSDPAVFDVEREGKVHVAFGAGPHRCLGSHLARIELQTLYDVILKRLPEFRLDPGRPVTFQAGMMLTIASLPLRWD